MRKRSLSRDTIRWQKMMRARMERSYPMPRFTPPQQTVSRVPFGNPVSYNPRKRHFSGFQYFMVAIAIVAVWVNL